MKNTNPQPTSDFYKINELIKSYMFDYSIANTLDSGLIIYDKERNIHFVNAKVRELIGLTTDDMVGYKLEDIFPKIFSMSREEYLENSPAIKLYMKKKK